MIHGRTRIKLYNPLSGHTLKDIVNENTFQGSVISEGLRNLGYAKASLYNTPDTSNPPFSEIIGGILIFDSNRIPANSQFAPLGVTMTGNGAYGVTNNDTPIELGSYDDNSSDIDITEKKIKMVYQYTRSQAIGTIGSICLTSKTGGYIGYGNSHGEDAATKYDLERTAGKGDICPQSNLGDYKATYNKIVCNGYQYSFSVSGTVLSITRFRVALKNASILDNIPETITKDVSSFQYSFMGSSYILTAHNKKIYISPNNGVKSGNFYLWVYDTETNILTEEAYNFGVPTIYVSVSQGKIFVPYNGTNKFEVFNMDGTAFDTITSGDGFVQSVYAGYGGYVGSIGERALVYSRDTGYNMHYLLYDTQSKTAYPANMKDYGYNRTQGVRTEETTKALIETFYAGGTSDRATWAFNNPLYLASINNLDDNDVVIKDTTKAMTVEYTLTES